MSVTIDNDTLNLIKTRIAYPSADEIILTNSQIKDYAVKHALDDYFRKFPKREEYEASITNESILDFPDAYTFGVLDCRIVGKGFISNSAGSFWDIVAFQSMGGYNTARGSNMYGSSVRGYNPNSLRQQQYMNRMASDTIANQGTFKYRVNQDESKLYVYSSISATVNVTWAKWTENFSDVHYQHKWDVIKLCQAYLMQHIADTAGIINDSGQEVLINTDLLREESKELLTEIREKWLEYPDTIVIRQ